MFTEPLLLSGRYRIETFLGQGGMARVYRGTDRVLGRTVAVKVLGEHLSGDPTFVQRFRREAQAAAGLSHPGVVAVFDTGSHDDLHYIVMELVEGRTLEEISKEEGPLRPGRAVAIAGAVCDALAAAHDKGLVHRDVKPGNIMIAPDGAVKVMDFGIARATTANTLTQTAMVVGTATYFSPEQARGDRVDGRSDIYSLGVVLYEMLTGQPPFTADSPVAVAYKHLHEDPAPPSSLNPDIGPDLEAVVLRAMAKAPAQRFQTAAEFRQGLEGVRATTSTDPLPAALTPIDPAVTQQLPTQPTAPIPVPVGRRRRPALWKFVALLAGTALAAVILVVAVLASGTTPDDLTKPGPSPAASATRSATSNPPTALFVNQAVAALQSALVDALAAGDIEEGAAREIEKNANEALKDYEKGRLDDALGKLEETRAGLGDLLAAGEVSQAAADDIDQALADLSSAMEAAPPDTPPPSDGDGGDEEGD